MYRRLNLPDFWLLYVGELAYITLDEPKNCARLCVFTIVISVATMNSLKIIRPLQKSLFILATYCLLMYFSCLFSIISANLLKIHSNRYPGTERTASFWGVRLLALTCKLFNQQNVVHHNVETASKII